LTNRRIEYDATWVVSIRSTMLAHSNSRKKIGNELDVPSEAVGVRPTYRAVLPESRVADSDRGEIVDRLGQAGLGLCSIGNATLHRLALTRDAMLVSEQVNFVAVKANLESSRGN
jgi:hypothetical protein